MSVLIKRYANRKLYNTQTSRYITLKGIAELIEAGEEVRVIDNETGEDITSVALSQILVDHERSNTNASQTLLSGLISRGGDALYEALRRGVGDASEGIGGLQDNVWRLIKDREHDASKLGEWIAVSTPDFDNIVQGAMERVFKMLDLPRRGRSSSLKTRSIAPCTMSSKSGVATAIHSPSLLVSCSRFLMIRRRLSCSSPIPSLASPTPRRSAP
jgi:polyhydroxyalkanoate synthesis repressor PhaR